MSNYENAKEGLREFLSNETEVVAILEGTNENKKHILAMEVALNNLKNGGSILFVTSVIIRIEKFLSESLKISEKEIKGVSRKRIFIWKNVQFFIETFASHIETPYDIDIAIIYPFDACRKKEIAEKCIYNLKRKAKKIICCTWADNRDWMNQIPGKRITYHIKEEWPEEHTRILSLPKVKEEKDYVYRSLINEPRQGENLARKKEKTIEIPISVFEAAETKEELEDWLLSQNPNFIKRMRKAREECLADKGKDWEILKEELSRKVIK